MYLEILNSIPQGILVFDGYGKIIYHNQIVMDKIDNNEIHQSIDDVFNLGVPRGTHHLVGESPTEGGTKPPS